MSKWYAFVHIFISCQKKFSWLIKRVCKVDSGASASIVCKDILHERHKTLKQHKNKWYAMAGTFNTTLKLKLPELNHFAKNLCEMPFDQ